MNLTKNIIKYDDIKYLYRAKYNKIINIFTLFLLYKWLPLFILIIIINLILI